jgi:cytochrome c oxidase cbb3-type subunit III
MPAVNFVKTIASALILWAGAVLSASAPVAPPQANRPAPEAGSGDALFAAQCGFCHGRDATGGQTGPDLTDSDLVEQDVNGDKIAPVVKNGRADKGMPPFSAMAESDLKKIVEYIHTRKKAVDASPGRRRKVSDADLATGQPNAGRAYFEGAGGCKTCHSPTGDLAGVASKYHGLALMQRMLYPTPGNAVQPAVGEKRKPNPATATITFASGQSVTGTLAYRDEFTIAITDSAGYYRSWPTSEVKVSVKDPLQAHADLLARYTDADIHNLFAYLQTLK